jgi:hypothetical protein
MSRYGYFLWIILLALAASITLACGNGPQRQNRISQREPFSR